MDPGSEVASLAPGVVMDLSSLRYADKEGDSYVRTALSVSFHEESIFTVKYRLW